MTNSFPRATRALRNDSGRAIRYWLLSILVLLAAWIVWAFRAPVGEYEVSKSARLQVGGSVYPLQSPLNGTIVSSTLSLGRQVTEGEVLAELDTTGEQLSLASAMQTVAALEPQSLALEQQIGAEQSGSEDEHRVLSATEMQAQQQFHQAESEAGAKERMADRDQALQKEGILAPADAERARADAQSARATAESLKAAIARLAPESQVRQRDREARLRQIAGEKARLAAQKSAALAQVERAQWEIERHRLRAPASGRLAECAVLRPGTHIAEGQQLGMVLPAGTIQVNAVFDPASALGKIRPGQTATIRLDGFPWAQYGTLSARVTHVADEVRDGGVRVELALATTSTSHIPLQHGLPGVVEIHTGQTTPAALLLRAAGAVAGTH